MPNKLENITIVRHLKDIDDLCNFGMNNPLEPGQEHIALSLGKTLRNQAIEEGYRGILMLISPKSRVTTTAQLLQQGMRDGGSGFRTSILADSNLRELDQGELKLPIGYLPGTTFEPLKIAWKVFWSETFTNHNLLYRFGSAYSCGEEKFPELKESFASPGESYRDQAVRLYTALLKFGGKLDCFNNIKPLVITHGAPLAIFRELKLIADDVLSHKLIVPLGGLVQLSWDYFNKREGYKHPDFGQVENLGLGSLAHPEILETLQREIKYLIHL